LSSILGRWVFKEQGVEDLVSPHSFEDKPIISFMSFILCLELLYGLRPKVVILMVIDDLRQSVDSCLFL